MSQDWTPEESHKVAIEQTEELRKKGFDLPLPRKDWIFNSNWMDWNLTIGGQRASITWDGNGKTEWDIYDGPSSKAKSLHTAWAPTFCEARLAAEKKLIEMTKVLEESE